MDFLDEILYNMCRWGLIFPRKYHYEEEKLTVKRKEFKTLIIVDEAELEGIELQDEVTATQLQHKIERDIANALYSKEERLRELIDRECQDIQDSWKQDFIEKSLKAMGEKKIGKVVYSSNKVPPRFEDNL